MNRDQWLNEPLDKMEADEAALEWARSVAGPAPTLESVMASATPELLDGLTVEEWAPVELIERRYEYLAKLRSILADAALSA